MAMFTVEVSETSYGFVELEASSEDEAREKADDAFHQGNVTWSSSEFSVSEVTRRKTESELAFDQWFDKASGGGNSVTMVFDDDGNLGGIPTEAWNAAITGIDS
jgi:hypothetical protein